MKTPTTNGNWRMIRIKFNLKPGIDFLAMNLRIKSSRRIPMLRTANPMAETVPIIFKVSLHL
jgi:hypothetical protein